MIIWSTLFMSEFLPRRWLDSDQKNDHDYPEQEGDCRCRAKRPGTLPSSSDNVFELGAGGANTEEPDVSQQDQLKTDCERIDGDPICNVVVFDVAHAARLEVGSREHK